MIYETRFLYALLMSITIETFIIALLLPKHINIYKRVSAGILPTALTLPYIWFLFPAFFGMGEFYRWISEIFAVIAEAWMIYMISSTTASRAFFVSLAANFVSFMVGVMIFRG